MLCEFLEQQKYFKNLQFDFRLNICSHALMLIVKNIQTNLDNEECTGGRVSLSDARRQDFP